MSRSARSLPFLMALLWIFFIVGLLEGAGWFYFQLPTTKPIGGYGYPKDLFISLPKLEYGYRPGYRGSFSGVYQHIPLEINHDGFRDREFPPKSPAHKRVLLLGDSVPFAPGIRWGERYSEILQELAREQSPAWEVFNLGVNSYSYWHYVYLLESPLLTKLQPDALLISFTLNDIQRMDSAWPSLMLSEKQTQAHWQNSLERFQAWLDDRYSAQLLKAVREQWLFYWMTHDEKEQYHTKWMRKLQSNWENGVIRDELRDNIQKSLEIAQAHQIPLRVVILPEINDVKHPEKFGLARTSAKEYLEMFKIPYCELHQNFKEVASLESYFLPGDSLHFSEKGHRLAAEAIWQCLKPGGPAAF